MSDLNSVSILLQGLKEGNEYASADLWNRYIHDLVRLARDRLRHLPRRDSDEEDLAICAFNAFFEGVKSNRFAKLDHREDLWQILVMLTDRRAVDNARKHLSKKRGSGKVRGESVFERADSPEPSPQRPISQYADLSPSPEFVAQFTDDVQNNLERLNDDTLRTIVVKKLQGFSNIEIAQAMDLSVSSVERKLRVIRQTWKKVD